MWTTRKRRLWRFFVISLTAMMTLTVLGRLAYVSVYGSPRLILGEGTGLPIYDLVFSPDGRMLASFDMEDFALRDTKSGRYLGQLKAEDRPGWAVRQQPFAQTSPDGSMSIGFLEAEGYQPRTLRIKDADGHVRLTLEGHPDRVNAITFSPDSRLLAVGGGFNHHPWPVNQGGDLRLFDTRSGKLLARYRRHFGAVSAVAFSPDGHELATAGMDGMVMLWNVDYP